MERKIKLTPEGLRALIAEEVAIREQDASERAREQTTSSILDARKDKKKNEDETSKEDEDDVSKKDNEGASKKGGGKRVKKVKKKKSKIKVSQNLVNKVKGLSEKDVKRIVKRMAKDQKRKNKIKELEAALEAAKNPAADVAADAVEKVEAETKAENPSVEKAADSSPVDKKGLKSLSQGTINTALNQLRNKGVSADKFQKTVVAAIKDIYRGAGPQRDNFAKSDAPIIKKISNEIGKILKGDFSNLVRESEDAIMVHSVTHNIIEALAKESKCDKEKRNV